MIVAREDFLDQARSVVDCIVSSHHATWSYAGTNFSAQHACRKKCQVTGFKSLFF